MVTVPEANGLLWEALDAVYAEQRDAALRAQQSIARLASRHPEIVRDPLAREALQAALARQDGINRYAESQLALAETMRSYWEQRSAALDAEPHPLPLVPRTPPVATGVGAQRIAMPLTVAE